MKKYCFGADIGGTTMKLGLFDADGMVLDKWEVPTHTENEGEAILPNLAKTILDKIEEKKLNKEEIAGIGVDVPGPVAADGSVPHTANLGWGYKAVTKELTELTGLPCKAGNDANVAALGEMWLGGGKGHRDVLMITLGTGVGGGIVIDGQILVGAHGVNIVFDGKVIAGTRGKKMRTKSYNAFSSINFPYIATIQDEHILFYLDDKELVREPVSFCHTMDWKVGLLKLIPALDATVLDYMAEHYDAVIIESFGVGGLPNYEGASYHKAVEKWISQGKIVVMTTQVTNEGSNMSVYEVGRTIKYEFGLLESYDMTLEATVTKLNSLNLHKVPEVTFYMG